MRGFIMSKQEKAIWSQHQTKSAREIIGEIIELRKPTDCQTVFVHSHYATGYGYGGYSYMPLKLILMADSIQIIYDSSDHLVDVSYSEPNVVTQKFKECGCRTDVPMFREYLRAND